MITELGRARWLVPVYREDEVALPRSRYAAPELFGDQPTMADAMFAPVCTRFRTYAVELGRPHAAYCRHIFNWPLMKEWTKGALAEEDEIFELDFDIHQ